MSALKIDKIFACPNCKNPVHSPKGREKCKFCGFKFKYKDGIWYFLKNGKSKTNKSLKKYDLLHKENSGDPNDGSYEVLASFASGNKTLDIACGQGQIEKLARETVGLDFSISALKKAKEKGAKYLVQADAHCLPFKNDSFDIAICAGSLEHFENPLLAAEEMARVSKIQILTVHKKYPLPAANLLRSLILSLKSIPDQPIDRPFSTVALEKLLQKDKMKPIFKGVWTYPYDFENLGFKVPNFLKLPSCHFVITTSK